MSQRDSLPDQSNVGCGCDYPDAECPHRRRELDCPNCAGVGEVLTEDGLHGTMVSCEGCEGTGSAAITNEMIDRGTFALLAERLPVRPDHAAPILEARREVKAVLRAALDEERK